MLANPAPYGTNPEIFCPRPASCASAHHPEPPAHRPGSGFCQKSHRQTFAVYLLWSGNRLACPDSAKRMPACCYRSMKREHAAEAFLRGMRNRALSSRIFARSSWCIFYSFGASPTLTTSPDHWPAPAHRDGGQGSGPDRQNCCAPRCFWKPGRPGRQGSAAHARGCDHCRASRGHSRDRR